MLHTTPPSDFVSRFTIVGCCIDVDGKILVLKRAPHKPQGGTWGLPAGKMDPTDQNTEQAILREVFEETGIQLTPEILGNPKKWYAVWPDKNFTWVCYRVRLVNRPEVSLNTKEHNDLGWFTLAEAMQLNLIRDQDATFHAMYDSGL